MRTTILLATLLAVGAVTGCIGDTSTDPGPSSDADVAPSSTSEATREANLTPASVHITHDYTQGGGEKTFEVANGTYATTHQLYFGPAQDTDPIGICALPAASITVEDPSGDVVYEVGNTGGLQLAVGGCHTGTSQHGNFTVLEPGTWTVVFEGQGAGTGHVVLEG